MITQVHQAMPEHSINQLCKTLQVPRVAQRAALSAQGAL